jgi:hypothetical protein
MCLDGATDTCTLGGGQAVRAGAHCELAVLSPSGMKQPQDHDPQGLRPCHRLADMRELAGEKTRTRPPESRPGDGGPDRPHRPAQAAPAPPPAVPLAGPRGHSPATHGDGFPAPAAVLKAPPERLRSAGLSRPKPSYVLGIAQRAVEGHVPTLADCHGMTDAQIVERLTSIKGVGRWTVEMLLIFNLGRPDVLPVNDLGIRKGFQFAYRKRRLPEPEQLARRCPVMKAMPSRLPLLTSVV